MNVGLINNFICLTLHLTHQLNVDIQFLVTYLSHLQMVKVCD